MRGKNIQYRTRNAEIISQNGKFFQRYQIDSSDYAGFHVDHASATHPSSAQPGKWIQHDLAATPTFNGVLVARAYITDGTPFSSLNGGILDARLGFFEHYDFRTFPRETRFSGQSSKVLKTEMLSNGDIKLCCDAESDKTVMYISTQNKPIIYRMEHSDSMGRLTEESQILEFDTKEGVQVPKKLVFKRYAYFNGGARQLVLQREIHVETVTLDPQFPSSAFQLDFANADVIYDRLGRVKIPTQSEMDDIILGVLDREIFLPAKPAFLDERKASETPDGVPKGHKESLQKIVLDTTKLI